MGWKKIVLFITGILIGSIWTSAQCPTITVIGPAGVTLPGDKMTFRAEVVGDLPNLQFSWKTSGGVMTEGQGTPVITIQTDNSLEGESVAATVTIEGLPDGCDKSASDRAPVARIEGDPLDEWADDELRPDDRRARLDNFFMDIANNPHHTGLVVLYVPKGGRFDSQNKRIRFVLSHARFRKFDQGRIWFALERSTFVRTILWRFPPEGADDLPCKGCLIIKGGDIR